MKIGMISKEYPPFFGGGVGTYVYQMSRAFAEAGHEVHVFTVRTGERDDVADPPGVHVHRALYYPPQGAHTGLYGPWTAANDWLYLARLMYDLVKDFVEHNELDVVEVPEWEASAWMLLLDPMWTVLTVVKCHTPTWLLQEINNQPPLRGQSIEKLQLALADGVCAPCTPMADQVAKRVKTEHPIEIVPYPYYAEDVTSEYTAPDSKRMIFVGRLEARKGVVTLAKALNPVLDRHPDAEMLLVGGDTPTAPGGGSMGEYVRSLLRPEHRKRVRFIDAMPADELFQLHRTAAFFVFPSRFENFPNVCLEAMASGRTAVVTEGTGMVEMLEGAGVVVPPNDDSALSDAMNALLDDREKIEQLGKAAYHRLRERFDPQRIVREKVNYYERVNSRNNTDNPIDRRIQRVGPEVWAEVAPEMAEMMAAMHRGGPSVSKIENDPIVERILQKVPPASGNGYALYGAGRHTAKLLPHLETLADKGVRIVCVIDDDVRRQGTSVGEVPVYETEYCAPETVDGVILSSDAMESALWERAEPLRKKGVKVYRLYEFD